MNFLIGFFVRSFPFYKVSYAYNLLFHVLFFLGLAWKHASISLQLNRLHRDMYTTLQKNSSLPLGFSLLVHLFLEHICDISPGTLITIFLPSHLFLSLSTPLSFLDLFICLHLFSHSSLISLSSCLLSPYLHFLVSFYETPALLNKIRAFACQPASRERKLFYSNLHSL